MAYETLNVDIDDHVAVIRLNRPEAMNALNAQMMGELADAIGALEANDKVRCTILTGSEKTFAAGADIAELAEKSFVEVFTADQFGPLTRKFQTARKPIIASVAGYALGGGCELAMACDIRVAAPNLKFGFPIARTLGNCLSAANLRRLSDLMGPGRPR